MSTASLSLEGAGESSESGAKKLSSTILHPKDQLHFFFLLLVWTMILVATGMESFLTVANFLVANVFDHLMLRSWDWRVTYFYFVILLERVETAGTPDVNILSVASK